MIYVDKLPGGRDYPVEHLPVDGADVEFTTNGYALVLMTVEPVTRLSSMRSDEPSFSATRPSDPMGWSP
jgi:hypothetical protein